MIDISQQLSGFDFTQDSQIYAIVELENKLKIVPALILGNVTTVMLPKKYINREVPIIAYSYRNAVIQRFQTDTESEESYREVANLNVANSFYCFSNNIFVEESLRQSLNGEEPANLSGIKQGFIDFLAMVVNESYVNGTSALYLTEELKSFCGYLLQSADCQHFIYDVMEFIKPAMQRFNDLYFNVSQTNAEQKSDLSDDTLSFIGGLFDERP